MVPLDAKDQDRVMVPRRILKVKRKIQQQ